MANLVTVRDVAPIYGMNTYDDPKVLKPGECLVLLNARPGNPPRPRTGMNGVVLQDTGSMTLVPPGISFFYGSTEYVLFWMKNASNQYSLVAYPVSTTGLTSERITFDTNATFWVPNSGLTNGQEVFSFINSNGQMIVMFSTGPISLFGKELEFPGVIEHDGTNHSERSLCISAELATGGTIVPFITAAADASGPFVTGDCVSYAMTYVRLGYTSNGSATPSYPWESGTPCTGMVIPADVKTAISVTASKPKAFTVQTPGLLEGPENPADRAAIDFTFKGKTTIRVGAIPDAQTLAEGASHIRIWRSRIFTGTDRVENAKAAVHYYVTDVPILTMPTTPVTYLEYTDTISDDAIEASGTAYQLTAYKYTNPPVNGPYSRFVKSRLWIYKDGVAYCSEAPGGDGGHQLEDAFASPQKWSGWFKPIEYRVDCDSDDGQRTTGVGAIGDDLFFFKDSKTFMLQAADITNRVQRTSNSIGCVFPHTITEIDAPGLGRCVLFMSNQGPAVITEGGQLRLFNEFKIAELWPDKSLELYGDLEDNYEYIVNNVTAKYADYSWHVMYKNAAGTVKWFAYYFGPANTEVRGPWQLEPANGVS